MDKVENRAICKECGGYCCKKCGCDYFVSDFESLKIENIEELLATGRVSIVAALEFIRTRNDELIANPFLYLRARNINRGEIDLLSFKTTCASLTEEGCFFDLEKRPSGGACLIPKVEKNTICCYSEVDRTEELRKWAPYQTVLQKVVKRHTGMSVYSRLRMDAENLFYDILSENFEGVAKAELVDVLSGIGQMMIAFPEEYQNALIKSKNAKKLIYKKDK